MQQDLLTDNNNDLIIKDGDFVIGDSDMQHIDHIIRANKGDFKESPLIGFGIARYTDATVSRIELDKFKKNLQIQLEYDGFSDITIEANDFKNLFVDGNRL